MPIVGYYMDKILAKKTGLPKGRVDIKSGSKIVSIEKTKTGIKKKEDSLAITYEFKTMYEPGIGEIKMRGRLIYVGDDVDKGLKMWNDKKEIPGSIEVEVKNFLFRKCLGAGITISENMNLPPPVFFPMVSKRPTKKEISKDDLRYIG